MIELDPQVGGKQRVWQDGRLIGVLVEDKNDGTIEWCPYGYWARARDTEWFKTREVAVAWIEKNDQRRQTQS